MVTSLESLLYCFQSFSPGQGCFNLELMENLSGTGTHGADATQGTQGGWGDTHWHRIQQLLRLYCHCLGLGEEHQPKRRGKQLRPFMICSQESEVWVGSQQREARARRSGANLSPWRPSKLQNEGRGLLAVLKNYFISLFLHSCPALGDQMRDWANEEAETFSFKDVLSELFIKILILLWIFQHLSFMRIVDSHTFTLSNLMYCRSFPICSFMFQNLSTESVFDKFREKYPQYFLFLRKNIFKKDKCFINI